MDLEEGVPDDAKSANIAELGYLLSFWTIIVRDLAVAFITSYHAIRQSKQEQQRMMALQDHATAETHLVNLELLFESVMPRQYFISFLNEKAISEEHYLDCLDIF